MLINYKNTIENSLPEYESAESIFLNMVSYNNCYYYSIINFTNFMNYYYEHIKSINHDIYQISEKRPKEYEEHFKKFYTNLFEKTIRN